MNTISGLSVIAVSVLMGLFAIAMYVTDFSDPRSPANIYKGYYYSGLEVLSFYPCDSNESWWVDQQPVDLDMSYRRITGITDQLTVFPKPLYIEFAGTISELGEYGHFGMYPREVKIDELIVADRVYSHDRQCKPNGELPTGGVFLEVPTDGA